MSGIAIVLDLARKHPNLYSTPSLHSYGLFSAAVAAAAAAASTPLTSRFPFRLPVAYCDAGVKWSEEYSTSRQSTYGNIHVDGSLGHSTKIYRIELKPLFSAFEFKALAMTSLRSFLLFYLPLLEPRTHEGEDDDDFPHDDREGHNVDLVVPFKKSVKQIIRETTVVTTRRILERLAVHYVSQRMAWKLLKDVPKSAARKAQRGMSTLVYTWSVSKTTFRGHLLGVAASWLVQVGIETYRCFRCIFKPKEDEEEVDPAEQVIILGKKVYVTTLKCGASLIFASVGAGIGATLVRPSVGQWIGCAIGDLTGPVVVSFCFEKFLHLDL